MIFDSLGTVEIFASLGVQFFHFCVRINEPLKVAPSGIHTSSQNVCLLQITFSHVSDVFVNLCHPRILSAGPAFSRRDTIQSPACSTISLRISTYFLQDIRPTPLNSSKAAHVPVRPNQGIHSRSLLSNMLYAASLFLEEYVLVPTSQQKAYYSVWRSALCQQVSRVGTLWMYHGGSFQALISLSSWRPPASASELAVPGAQVLEQKVQVYKQTGTA